LTEPTVSSAMKQRWNRRNAARGTGPSRFREAGVETTASRCTKLQAGCAWKLRCGFRHRYLEFVGGCQVFIDYLTVMLVNMVAGLVILAWFVYRHIDGERKRVGVGFLITGSVASITGVHMIFTWPLPGSVNIAFGDTSVMFGFLFLFAGIAVLADWELLPLTIYAAFAGFAAVVLGARIISLGMTNSPALAGVGFLLAGFGGMLTFPVYLARRSLAFRVIVAIILLIAAVIWAITAYGAYWQHLEAFSKWPPGGPK
jgi:putative membrane protein